MEQEIKDVEELRALVKADSAEDELEKAWKALLDELDQVTA